MHIQFITWDPSSPAWLSQSYWCTQCHPGCGHTCWKWWCRCRSSVVGCTLCRGRLRCSLKWWHPSVHAGQCSAWHEYRDGCNHQGHSEDKGLALPWSICSPPRPDRYWLCLCLRVHCTHWLKLIFSKKLICIDTFVGRLKNCLNSAINRKSI